MISKLLIPNLIIPSSSYAFKLTPHAEVL